MKADASPDCMEESQPDALEEAREIYLAMEEKEEQLIYKRRWLMGLEENEPPEEGTIPESFLREDDVFYDKIKEIMGKGNQINNVIEEPSVPEDFGFSHHDLKELHLVLDDMTSGGLRRLGKIINSGSDKLGTTKKQMKHVIKKHLRVLTNDHNSIHRVKVGQISQLLVDPKNFCGNHAALNTKPIPRHARAIKILDRLEDLSYGTLKSMYRKIRGVKGYIPKLQPKECMWNRDRLIDPIRKYCNRMFLEPAQMDDKQQEQIAKALAVADLKFKLDNNSPLVSEFQKFSPEIEALQNDIAKAIKAEKHLDLLELRKLQSLLDPNAELGNRSLRTAIRNLLIQFFLECSDMDVIPDSLLKTVATINELTGCSPDSLLSKEDTEEEVETLLDLSSKIKQVVWENFPEMQIDQDFADAYMDDFEESDDDGDFDDEDHDMDLPTKCEPGITCSNSQLESIGENNPTNCRSPLPKIESLKNVFYTPSSLDRSSQGHGLVRENNHIDPVEPPNSACSDIPGRDADFSHDKQRVVGNLFLSAQEACDKTSMVACNLIGHLLDRFVLKKKIQKNNVAASKHYEDTSENQDYTSLDSEDPEEKHISYEEVLDIVGELMPSLPKSAKSKTKGALML